MSLFLLAKRIKLVFTSDQIIPRFFHSNPARKFMRDYLVDSFGVSPDKAATISNRLTHTKPPDDPKTVLRFLDNEGFSKPDVQTIITWHPNILYATPMLTLEHYLRALRGIGLSSSALNQIILSSPSILQLFSAVPRIMFWLNFFSGDETALVNAFKVNHNLAHYNIDNGNIARNISLYQSEGVPTHNIRMIALTIPRFITRGSERMKNFMERAKKLGFRPQSEMFGIWLNAVASGRGDRLHKKMKLLQSFGWSEDEFLSALHTAPCIIKVSEKNLRAIMDFLIREARHEPSYIASHPKLLLVNGFEKWYDRASTLLESNGLSDRGLGFYYAMDFINIEFLCNNVAAHKEDIEELNEAYLAVCTSGSK